MTLSLGLSSQGVKGLGLAVASPSSAPRIERSLAWPVAVSLAIQ